MQEMKMSDRAPRKGKEMDTLRAMRRLRSPTFHTCQFGLPGDGITYVNDDGKEVKIDKAGRPYPVGKDGFRLMKTSRPPEFTPEEWKMMSKYYTKEEKARGEGRWQKERGRSQE